MVKQQEQVSKKTIEQMRNALPKAAMAKDKQANALYPLARTAIRTSKHFTFLASTRA